LKYLGYLTCENKI